MKDIKNLAIVVLAGLLTLSIAGLVVAQTDKPFKGITKGQQVKIVEYDNCLKFEQQRTDAGQKYSLGYGAMLQTCLTYRP